MSITDKQQSVLDKHTPIRRGEIYCSPACGRNCTKAQHELAMMRGEMLADRMNQQQGGWKDWQCHVWENSPGWCYDIRRPVSGGNTGTSTHTQCDISECRNADGTIRSYWANIIVNGKQFHCTAETPEEAINQCMAELKAFHASFIENFYKFRAVDYGD